MDIIVFLTGECILLVVDESNEAKAIPGSTTLGYYFRVDVLTLLQNYNNQLMALTFLQYFFRLPIVFFFKYNSYKRAISRFKHTSCLIVSANVSYPKANP